MFNFVIDMHTLYDHCQVYISLLFEVLSVVDDSNKSKLLLKGHGIVMLENKSPHNRCIVVL